VSKSVSKIAEGLLHVHASFNNTIITASDNFGNVIAFSSAGAVGFSGTRKSTPFAAQMATEKVIEKLKERTSIKKLSILVNGPGSGRDSAIRAIGSSGLQIISIVDVTPCPHNGPRPQKKRRV